MTNTSIKDAFERMWQHVIAKLGDKANIDHNHNEMYYTESEVDSKLLAVNTNITNITNGNIIVKEAEHSMNADSATTANSATSATKATQDGSGNVIADTYETKTDAQTKLDEAKAYADSVSSSAATTVKNDLLNGAGTAYDTLKELGVLIDDNADAIEALETIASGKADATHSHAISDVSGLQSALDGKAASSHGTHVSFDSTNKPKMDGTAAFGTSSKVARADHVHPTDTSRASQADLDALESVVAGKADSGHSHSVATTSANGFMSTDMVTKLNGIASGANKTTVDSSLSSSSTNPVRNSVVTTAINSATSAISANTSSINEHTTAISNLQTAVSEIQEITSEEIQALFA